MLLIIYDGYQKKVYENGMPKSGDSVLIVDNDKDMCRVISDVLKHAGIKVNIAYDGESALAKIKRHPVDLMLLDYKLPGISGLTVLEKSRQIRPNLKTIMISAFGDESTKDRAKELGAYAFLDKPFNIDRLVKVVEKALTKSEGILRNKSKNERG